MLQLNFTGFIRLIAVVFSVIISNSISSQAVISPALSPQVHWMDHFNPTTNMEGFDIQPDDGNLLDDDWFFDLEEITNAFGQSLGYVAVGYARDRDFIKTTYEDQAGVELGCFGSEIPEEANLLCEDFETTTRRKGLMRQVAVFYDLNGNVVQYFRYNQGEFYGAVQDGNYLYLVGGGANPLELTRANEVDPSNEPQLNSVPIYYNPTGSVQQEFDVDNGFNYTCGSDVYARKFNVIKIDLDGNVIWNNYYGVDDDFGLAFPRRGEARSLVIKGNKLLVVGRSDQVTSGQAQEYHFVISINKNTGYYDWKTTLTTVSEGAIWEVFNSGNYYAITGNTYDTPSGLNQGFVCAVESPTLAQSDFDTPLYTKTTDDVSSSLTGVTVNTSTKSSFSRSVIINNGKLIWFLMLNNVGGFTSGKNIVEDPVIIELNLSGNVTDFEKLDELRAYDMWLSGIPTDDGGFAVVSSRHSPTYFNTGNLPTPQTPLDPSNPTGPKIEDCYDNCIDVDDPTDDY